MEDRNEKRARVVSGRWSFEAVSLASARERRHEEVARSRAKRKRKSFENRLQNRSKSLFAAPWPSEKHGFYYTKRTWTLKKHGFYCTDRTSDVQNRSGAPRGDLGRFGGLRGCSRDAPGGARRALATLPARLGTPLDAPGTPRSDQKVCPGGPASISGSVLFGQSFARRSRDDFRRFLGRSGEARTSILLRPASVL